MRFEQDDFGLREACKIAEKTADDHAALFRGSGDPRSLGAMLLSMAEVHFQRGTPEHRRQAEQSALEALGLFRQTGEGRLEAQALLLLAHVHGRDGSPEAVAEARQAQGYFRGLGDEGGEARALHALGFALRGRRALDEAVAASKGALALLRGLKRTRLAALELHTLATWSLAAERPAAALQAAAEAQRLFAALGCGSWCAAAGGLIAQAHIESDEADRALVVAQEGLARARGDGTPEGRADEAVAGATLARVHLALEDLHAALRAAEEGLAICRGAPEAKHIYLIRQIIREDCS